jgi:class 3 adenylate cyclase/tetratricopeptide (TPR) repeat protein
LNCPRCQAENRPDRRFCGECGAPLVIPCPVCGFSNEPAEKFCGGCGKPLSTAGAISDPRFASPGSYTPKHLAEKILTSRSALQGERKWVTVLFCDIANSTPLAERLGPEGMHVLLDRFFELAVEEVHRYEGTVNQFLGDGFMALFGAPLAHEDHALRAILTALAIQRALPEQGAELGLPPGEELSLRMGVNSGPVVVGKIGDNLRMDYTAVGDTTHLAARLQQLAEPGAILASEVTSRQVRGYVRLESVGPLPAKGIAQPVAAYKVLGLEPRRSSLEALGERSLADFVGRNRELADLHELLAQVERGQGQVVGIVGEPGVGKSRLVYELRQSLVGGQVTYLEGRCLSYGGNIPYLPVVDQLRNNCGITETDPPDVIAQKVRVALEELGLNPEQGAPYLLHLLGLKDGAEQIEALTAEAIKERTFDTLQQMSLLGSRRRPLILAVEDLHWIDKTSEEYFASLVENLAAASILLLTTHRPGYRPPWLEKSYASQLSLRPLTPADSLSVMHSVVQRQRLSDALGRTILERAEGNPFFLEELTRAVVEQGERADRPELPDTVQAVLMARIDRLADEPKRLLQTASVLGREFSSRLLGVISEGAGGLEAHLRQLKRIEFIYEQSGGEEPVYVFKHALTQEVAYASLLTFQREALHASAGRALEMLYVDRLEVVHDRLAYHYSKTQEREKAVEYLTRVAEKAAGIDAHAEAVAALEEAHMHAEGLSAEERDRSLVNLLVRRAHSLHFLGRRQELVELLLRHQDCLERLREPMLAGEYHFWLGFAYSFLGHRPEAAQNLQRSLEEATRAEDESLIGRVHRALAMECTFSGRPLDEAVAHGRQAAALLEKTEDRFWLSQALWILSQSCFYTGDFELALEIAARLDAVGETTGSRRARAEAATLMGLSYATRGDWATGIVACRRGLEISPDDFETAFLLACLGKAHVEGADAAQAIPVLEQAVDLADQVRSRQIRAWFRIWLGEAYLLSCQIDAAREMVGQALQACTDVNYLVGLGWSHQLLGRINQAEGSLAEAEKHLTHALETLFLVQARFETGRTHLFLASVAHAQGRAEEAERHLSEARSLFQKLRVPRYLDQAEQLARQLCLPPWASGLRPSGSGPDG